MNKKDFIPLILVNRGSTSKPLVLDIGCYDGKDSKELADLLNAEVHCFEPDPLSADLFRSLHEDDPRLILYELAVCDHDKAIVLHQSNHPQSNSILEPKEHLNLFPAVKFDEESLVRCCRLDTWYENKAEGKIIDLIWADVNGAEELLVRGGLKALANTRYLYIECARKELYSGQPYYDPSKQNNMITTHLSDFRLMQNYNWGESFGNILLKNIRHD